MTDQLTFLPWLRRGLAQAIDAVDPADDSALAGGARVTARVTVARTPAERVIRLLGPELAVGLPATQVLREEPRADSADVEPNYFPFVELASPDLPWLLTPAAADPETGRLRPWLVLVVVREQDGVTVGPYPGTTLDVLRIGDPAEPAAELPDLAESWAWAHVQSVAAVDGVAAAVAGATGEVVARVVCPRRLLPDSAWHACVVPAFLAGVERGLGRETAAGAELLPAWTFPLTAGSIELPVYYHWRFTTGAAGDFEALCRRLKPDGDGADLGRFPMEVGDPGLVRPAAGRVLLDMEGALETPGVLSRVWDAAHQTTFQEDMTLLLNAGAGRAEYDPDAGDPVVAPPLYGIWPAGVDSLPAHGWVRTTNLHPVRRAAAGLGAAVVRADQEALVAAAWEQADALRATMTALNSARLGAEVGRSLTRRASTLPDPDLLQLTSRAHAFLRTGGTTVRGRLAESAIPGGLVSPAYLRQTRPGTALARDWTARTVAGARLGADHTKTTIDATKLGATELAPALAFAQFGLPDGAQAVDRTLTDVVSPALPARRPAGLDTAVGGLLGARMRKPPRRLPARVAGAVGPLPPWHPSGTDVSGIAATVRSTLDPLLSVRTGLIGRIPALGGVLPAGELPTTLGLAPVFEDPLSDDLTRLGTNWLLPGVGKMRRNRVRLVEVNTTFVGQLMIGANNEIAKELLWRGYPVDVRATFFRRFWDYVDEPRSNDISELRGWTLEDTVAENMEAATSTSTVIVVRGDVVRRYPTAHYFLQAAALDGEEATPVEGAVPVEVTFVGSLDRDTVFFGFGLDSDDVRGDRANGVPGYFLAIEEQAGAPRLGLDAAKPAHYVNDPKSWDKASWGHIVASEEELEALTHAPATTGRLAELGELDGVTWGRNAAHLARATWQRPFRMYIHADLLV